VLVGTCGSHARSNSDHPGTELELCNFARTSDLNGK
jgi:hypothetical protein